MKLTIGSRGSKLALWQAHWVRDQLASAGHEIIVRIIKTTGDKLQAVAPGEPPPEYMAQTVAEAGTKGLFIKEIEEALLAQEIDVAVHSLKDLPTDQPPGLILAAVPQREDSRDVLISRHGHPLGRLPQGARVATGSLRRQTYVWPALSGPQAFPVSEPACKSIAGQLAKVQQVELDGRGLFQGVVD